MRQSLAYDEDVGDFSPPAATNENLTCDFLVAGGGLSGLSAADAAIRRGLNVVVIEKGVYGKGAASGLSAGQFLTGWAKSVDVMIAELAQQDMQKGIYGVQARRRAERRVRAFLRRTVEGCQRLEELDRDYNLRASVQHGACTAAITEVDMASLEAAYRFMEKSNLRALMPLADKRRPPFFEVLSARQLQRRYGTAEGFYAGGVIDRFGGSFRPRKFLIGLARALRKRSISPTIRSLFFVETAPPSERIRCSWPTLMPAISTATCSSARSLNTITSWKWNCRKARKRSWRAQSFPIRATPASTRAATAVAFIWATRKLRRPHPRSCTMWPVERWKKANACFLRCTPSASATSRTRGPGGCTTRWMITPSWNAATADA